MYYTKTTIDLLLRARLEVCNECSFGIVSYRIDLLTGSFHIKEANEDDLWAKSSDVIVWSDA